MVDALDIGLGIALGISVNGVAVDAVVLDVGRSSAAPVVLTVDDLRGVAAAAVEACGVMPARIGLAHPAWWSALRVDQFLRDVRESDLAVDRYFTSGEAAVRWARQRSPAALREFVLVHDVMADVLHDAVVRVHDDVIETVTATNGALSVPGGASMLTVGARGTALEHAVASGAALAVLA